jgi:ABC-type multidrug transport system fused ATPase/permease subunit
VGRSSSGKTTVLQLLNRLYDIEKGIILIDGQNIRNVALKSLRAVMVTVRQVYITGPAQQ